MTVSIINALCNKEESVFHLREDKFNTHFVYFFKNTVKLMLLFGS